MVTYHYVKFYVSIIIHLGLFQEKIPGRVGTPLIFFYLGGGHKMYFFSGGWETIWLKNLAKEAKSRNKQPNIIHRLTNNTVT
jgi:hypothetical protein